MFSFNHVTISAADLEKTIAFYELFGFRMHKEYHDETVDIVMLKLGNMVLEIFHYDPHDELPEHSRDLGTDLKTVGNKHFALGVRDINEARSFVEDNGLNDGGIVIREGRLGRPYFFIRDPNGILMELIEDE